jgi:DNA-binding MarR family transcriptional regulator
MPRGRVSKSAIAADAWRHLFDFFVLTRPQRNRVLERLGLTPNDVRALSSLEAGAGQTMRSLAEAWSCDASNATWMVDRLEQRGLAERRAKPGDRRVKLVALTPAGSRTKKEVQAGMYRPPADLLRLPQETLERLRDAAAHLPRSAAHSRPHRGGRHD